MPPLRTNQALACDKGSDPARRVDKQECHPKGIPLKAADTFDPIPDDLKFPEITQADLSSQSANTLQLLIAPNQEQYPFGSQSPPNWLEALDRLNWGYNRLGSHLFL